MKHISVKDRYLQDAITEQDVWLERQSKYWAHEHRERLPRHFEEHRERLTRTFEEHRERLTREPAELFEDLPGKVGNF